MHISAVVTGTSIPEPDFGEELCELIILLLGLDADLRRPIVQFAGQGVGRSSELSDKTSVGLKGLSLAIAKLSD